MEFRLLGLEQIGLWLPRVQDFGVLRTLDLLTDSNLQASSLGWIGGFTGSNGYTFNEAVEEARQTIWLASQLGAPVVHVATGGRNSHTTRHLRRITIEGLRRIVESAELANVNLALHPMSSVYRDHWTFLHSLNDVLGIVEEVDHPRLGLGLNTYHVADDPDLFQVIQHRSELIKAFTLSDAIGGPRQENDAVMIGLGTLPLDSILAALQQSSYAGNIELDVWSERFWASEEYAPVITQAIDDFARWSESCSGLTTGT